MQQAVSKIKITIAVLAVLVVLLLMLQYKIWLGDDGVPKIVQLQDKVHLAQTEANKLKERNMALNAEVRALKMGLDAIEERARSELGMIGKDEVYYQVIEDRPKSIQTTNQTEDSVSNSVTSSNE
jgi:cell division protein FtsB